MPTIQRRRITLSVPSASLSLVLDSGESAEGWYKRANPGGYKSGGKTPQGATKLNRNNFPSFYIWTITTLVKQPEQVIFDRIKALVESNPLIQVSLFDEHERIDILQSNIHNRNAVLESQIVIQGIPQVYCAFNVLLQTDENYKEFLGAGRWRLTFALEELI